MRIFYTTPEFVYKGLACPGIPFLCTDNMEFVPEVNDFLLWLAMENAKTRSPSTWESYAEALYDYFSWLSANTLAWNGLPIKDAHGEEISNLAMYRNWSADLVDPETRKNRIKVSTIRRRLRQVMSFYRWALKRKRIDALPWEESFQIVQIPEAHPSMYRNTRAGRFVGRNNLLPTVPKNLPQLLRLDQCKSLLNACGTETLQLMTKLMLQTGLRNEECRTFPRKYVFDPSPQDRNQRIALNLQPGDMALKGSKPRRVYLSWQLLKELFDYLNFGEGAQRSKRYRQAFGSKPSVAFLTEEGEPWAKKGLNNAYRKLWASNSGKAPLLSFKVRPHMLRHTFATCELYAESIRKNLGAALAWVRDRLGHSSIASTTIYVHCLDMMGEADLNMYQREIDALLVIGHHAKT